MYLGSQKETMLARAPSCGVEYRRGELISVIHILSLESRTDILRILC